ncbi:MAG: hypothetical protein SGI87_08035 [Flavobacteriales bacterium]|nr:hypothetical protein [Flavobacteriales bacterium]
MTTHENILRALEGKSITKQNVFANTQENFKKLKERLKSCVEKLEKDFGNKDSRITFGYADKGDFQAEIKVAGDILFFTMHTNAFQFDQSHSLWKSTYLKDHPENSYVGIINIYNFLADSFKYNRTADVGYLVGRIFINRENHFLVQGKKNLGFRFNDFVNSTLNDEVLCDIVEQAILHCLDFDLLAPPYENVKQLSVEEIQSITESHALATGKRLGFQFGLNEKSMQ